MNATLTIDKAGRVVLPKAIRDEMHLVAGDTLEVRVEGEHVVLSPVRPQVGLHKEHGFWVYSTGKKVDFDIPELIEQGREERDREILGLEE